MATLLTPAGTSHFSQPCLANVFVSANALGLHTSALSSATRSAAPARRYLAVSPVTPLVATGIKDLRSLRSSRHVLRSRPPRLAAVHTALCGVDHKPWLTPASADWASS